MDTVGQKSKEETREAERREIRKVFQEYAVNKDEKLKEKIVLHYMNLVRYLAGKFASRGEPLEDLVQVGCIGLVKAVDRYDLSKGAEFTTYVTPTIVGELKRHFRDKGWAFKVPRRLQELNGQVSRAAEELSAALNRPPSIGEIAEKLHVTDEEVLEAQELGQSYSPLSLDLQIETEGDRRSPNLLDYLGKKDLVLEGVDDRLSLQRAFEKLESKEQLVLYLRFYENLSQNEIAKHLQTLQMHVSRVQARAIQKLKKLLSEEK